MWHAGDAFWCCPYTRYVLSVTNDIFWTKCKSNGGIRSNGG